MLDWIVHIHWGVLFQIVLIDVLLGGDNAVVIAMACKNLGPKQRRKGIFWGTFVAILLRVVLIVFTLQILNIPFLKVFGGALLFWIGAKLIYDQEDHNDIKAGGNVFEAVKTIAIADFVMSLDNVMGLAGVAESAHEAHQIFYIIFGLLLSVPIIVWGSGIVLKLLDRFPVIVLFGSGLLGWIGIGMILTDRWVVTHVLHDHFVENSVLYYIVHLMGALLVVGVGELIRRQGKRS